MTQPDYGPLPARLARIELRDVPYPHVWYWPRGVTKRRVYVRVSTYIDLDPDASHYYITIERQGNVVWTGRFWAEPWSHQYCVQAAELAPGQQQPAASIVRKRCASLRDAVVFVNYQLERCDATQFEFCSIHGTFEQPRGGGSRAVEWRPDEAIFGAESGW